MKNNSKEFNTAALAADYARLFIKDPLFMFFCPDKSKRADFIEKYFLYYIEKWASAGEYIPSGSKNIAAVLTDPDKFQFRFSGRKSFGMKYNKYSYNIFNHMEVVQNIVNIVVPEQMKKRVLTIYAAPEVCADDINTIIDLCKSKAEQENFVLVYETFTKRFIELFENKGFETGYSRQFMNTQFFQTVMTYNI